MNTLIDSKDSSRGDYKLIMESLATVDDVLGIMQSAERIDPAAEGAEARGGGLRRSRPWSTNGREPGRRRTTREADAIREKLKEKGVVVQDTPDGPVVAQLVNAILTDAQVGSIPVH